MISLPTQAVEEPEVEEVVINCGSTPALEEQKPLPNPEDGEQLFQATVGDVLPMIEERINRIARSRPFLEKFMPINDNSPHQTLSPGANELTTVILLLAHFHLSSRIFL